MTTLTRLERFFFAPLALLAVVGVLTPSAFNALPAESILDAAFFVGSVGILISRPVSTKSAMLAVIAVSYLFSKALVSYFGGETGLYDFVQGYKAYIYLPLILLYARTKTFSPAFITKLTWCIAISAFVKYSYSRALGLDPRPGIYGENNFELLLLSVLVYLSFSTLPKRSRWQLLILFSLVVVLSGSRSGATELAIVVAALLLDRRNRDKVETLAVLAVVTMAGAALFASRGAQDGGGIEASDRYRFFEIFAREFSARPLMQQLFGAPPLTPLSHSSCDQLSFYSLLFSHTYANECYSVILHSFLFRALLDQGYFGTALLFALLLASLVHGGTRISVAITVLLVITANGVSVSAFNNIFATLALIFTIGSARQKDPHSRLRQSRRERYPNITPRVKTNPTKPFPGDE